jgi:hypothetical protein
MNFQKEKEKKRIHVILSEDIYNGTLIRIFVLPPFQSKGPLFRQISITLGIMTQFH